MTFGMTEGCVAWSYEVDGKQFVDYSIEEQRKIVHKLIDNCTQPIILQDFYMQFMREYGQYENCGTCEECGDTIENYKLVLPD